MRCKKADRFVQIFSLGLRLSVSQALLERVEAVLRNRSSLSEDEADLLKEIVKFLEEVKS